MKRRAPPRLPANKIAAPDASGHPGPAELAVALVAAASVLLAVTFKLQDPDLWQHLLVGKVIWSTHGIPRLQLWSWPTYGAVDTTSSYSWAFRALIWPVWNAGGLVGLQIWRWATTLTVFVLLWKTARVLGARGSGTYFVLVLAALIYRQRAQVRPESLASILFAATLLLLELRRQQGRDLRAWLVLVLWLWVNVHVSYIIGFVLVGTHAMLELWARGAGRRRSSGDLWTALIASAAAVFVNPYGWRAVWQPFHFVLDQRQESIFRSIGELSPVDWRYNTWNGLPLLLAGWTLLQLWRWRRGRVDLVEVVLFVLLTYQALSTSRFVGYWALIAAPFVARGFAEFTETRRLRRLPRGAGALASIAGCVLALPLELGRPDMPFGVGFVPYIDPKHACEFVAQHGIRGRFFNHFEFGGYLLWRFWPERDRLPFMDVHQAGTRRERVVYMQAMVEPTGWRDLVQTYGVDVALLRRFHAIGDRSLDLLDADSTWALVFADDAAAVYLRRTPDSEPLIRRFEYALVPGGTARLASFETLFADDRVRPRLRQELDRMVASSPVNSTASSLRAYLELFQGRIAEAERDLERAHTVDPLVPRYYERLGRIAIVRGEPRRALALFARQQREEQVPEIDLEMAKIQQGAGDRGAAIRAYRRAARDPSLAGEAEDSLRALRAGR